MNPCKSVQVINVESVSKKPGRKCSAGWCSLIGGSCKGGLHGVLHRCLHQVLLPVFPVQIGAWLSLSRGFGAVSIPSSKSSGSCILKLSVFFQLQLTLMHILRLTNVCLPEILKHCSDVEATSATCLSTSTLRNQQSLNACESHARKFPEPRNLAEFQRIV